MTSHAGSSQTNISAPLNRVEEHSNYLPEDAGPDNLETEKLFGR
jgi:hypothetical protein